MHIFRQAPFSTRISGKLTIPRSIPITERVFFVGVESSGIIFAYALNHVDGSFRRVATIASGQAGVMDWSFDRETNKLWSYCDNTCNNRSTLLAVDMTPGSTFGRFRIRAADD